MSTSLKLLFLILLFSTPSLALEVHGHRGARARFPENTLPAFEYALKLGVNYLEMDMAVTKDGMIVISHEPRISHSICVDSQGKRFTEEPLIHDLTLSEVKRYDCGTLKNPRFPKQTPVPGTRIPTLDEVFAMTEKSVDPHAKTVRFNIETKIYKEHPEYTVDPETFVKQFLKVVKAHQMEDRVILQSFDLRTLDALRKINTTIPLVALIEDPKLDMPAIAKAHGIEIMSPACELVTEQLVKTLHASKVKVVPWTADDEPTWRKMAALQVDGIISDDPEAMMRDLHLSDRLSDKPPAGSRQFD